MPPASKFTATLMAWLLGFGALHTQSLWAADQSQPVAVATTAEEPLEEVIIIGSLIPRARPQTVVTTATISAEDLQARGFASVASALQQSAFSSGSVQGAQFTGNFTAGARTLSLFGLSPSYVKYLVDGRPMSDYPALYNGSDTITDIGGIPEAFLDHIDVLPGGQSSLYGSDAIAGVVNVVLIKKLDAPLIEARYGFYGQGGGNDRRIALADTFGAGPVQVLAGLQYDNVKPMWGYQRDLTRSYFTAGTGPVVAERDYALADSSGNYYFVDPSHCANVTALYWGSVAEHTRDGQGNYCGTT
ncbi:MAG TPA: TonB-dependent receptor plug domain-containing protein, partial [Steroidobacteraceae bacterium]|nr:TonB-dependent receptor plug domain-containing protein [Steroidobacteraceae bacterium]